MRTVLFGLLVVAVSACSDSIGPPGDISGDWVEDQSVAGNSFTFTLGESGRDLVAIGAFRGEAGPAGTLIGNGTIGGRAVHLDLVVMQAVPTADTTYWHFDGTVVGSSTLVGSITGDTPPEPSVTVRYHRS